MSWIIDPSIASSVSRPTQATLWLLVRRLWPLPEPLVCLVALAGHSSCLRGLFVCLLDLHSELVPALVV